MEHLISFTALVLGLAVANSLHDSTRNKAKGPFTEYH